MSEEAVATELQEVKVAEDSPRSMEQIEKELRDVADIFMDTISARSFQSSKKLLDGGKPNGNGVFAKLGGIGKTSRQVVEVALEWQEVTYTVTIGRGKSRKTKTVLDGMSGLVKPGNIVAVMGPTGSGKTSLLNVLAGRLPRGGTTSGQVLINGQPRSDAFLSISAYVLQDDVLFSGLTVRETFQTAANLRLDGTLTRQQKQEAVNDIIAELGLTKCADTYVGGPTLRGVSGGERKRTNIGVEMMSSPSLIFLDEPTSGLDSFQAQNVMESLWNLAHNGRTVVSTIHQPRSSIYNMFDLLLLLSEGRTMFFGPASQAVFYFWRFGFTCPEQYNPADFFLDVVSMDYRSPEVEQHCRRRIELLADAYEITAASAGKEVAAANEGGPGLKDDFTFATSWLQQFRVLIVRAFKQAARDRLPLVIGLVQQIVLGIILGVVFGEVEKTQKGINDINGILFFITIFTMMGNLFVVLNTFPSEKNIINRERSAKSYRLSAYFLSKLAVELPVRIFFSLLFSSIVYWMVGLNHKASHFFIFMAIILLNSLAAQGLGIMVSAAAKNEKMALALAPAVAIILIMFSGFYINVNSIPVWLRWLEYVSVMYYTFIALTINNFRGECCWACDTKCSIYDAAGKCQQYETLEQGCLRQGEQVLERLSFSSWHLWQAMMLQCVLLVAYNLLGFIALRRSKPRYQPLAPKKKAKKS